MQSVLRPQFKRQPFDWSAVKWGGYAYLTADITCKSYKQTYTGTSWLSTGVLWLCNHRVSIKKIRQAGVQLLNIFLHEKHNGGA
jgi:succinate-acetate transporter protein